MKRTAKAFILFFIGFLLVSVSYTERLEAKEANLIFKILTNTQPPSAPAEMTPEQQLESLKVLRDSPPQGTPAKMSPEQIESMKVLRDSPPPANPNAHPIGTTINKNHSPPGS